MIKPKIYIIGMISAKIKKDPFAVVLKFEEVAKTLRDLNFIPINPMEVVNDLKCSWSKAMKQTIPAMLEADGVIMLNDYHDSEGSIIEMKLAFDLGMFVTDDLDKLQKHFGITGKNDCPHDRIRKSVVNGPEGCETSFSRCEDCGIEL